MATQHSTRDFGSRYKFNGKELDKDTGWYYYGARYYVPSVSNWLSVDPLAEKYLSFSPYAYIANNPMKYTDSTAMSIKTEIYNTSVVGPLGPPETDPYTKENIPRKNGAVFFDRNTNRFGIIRISNIKKMIK